MKTEKEENFSKKKKTNEERNINYSRKVANIENRIKRSNKWVIGVPKEENQTKGTNKY